MEFKKLTLPNNLECYYLGKEETEYIYSEIFTEQQYIRNGIAINEGNCIFDVGANIGLFSLFINKLQKKVKIYAFEPVREIFEILQANIRLHSVANISLFNYGLSSQNKADVLFTFYPNMAGNSTIKPIEKLEQRKVMTSLLNEEKVKYLFQSQLVKGEVKTLSSIVNDLNIRSIDLLKIDVEGEEYQVLQGINQSDWKKIKQVVIEVHAREGRLERIQEILTNNEFNVVVEKNSLVPDTLNTFNVYGVRP
ncbi:MULTISPECIES: FkbM family methyltransferase [Nostocales]|uniref:FkbM family methyltransferase n=2 Tax=Nostocales TaxID=1161 RepID=A0A8S9T4V9_9CYAN|nr:FkbM family methyltransferase [Tolypothrix bouteillei]KAF3886569.1 FkbM family methyltransferase [Tolypothrix bouteillei VB521301]